MKSRRTLFKMAPSLGHYEARWPFPCLGGIFPKLKPQVPVCRQVKRDRVKETSLQPGPSALYVCAPKLYVNNPSEETSLRSQRLLTALTHLSILQQSTQHFSLVILQHGIIINRCLHNESFPQKYGAGLVLPGHCFIFCVSILPTLPTVKIQLRICQLSCKYG